MCIDGDTVEIIILCVASRGRLYRANRYGSRNQRGKNTNNNYCIPQGMTRTEREELKVSLHSGNAGDIQSLERTLIMIAHWMRQGQRVFIYWEYASQWTEAQRERSDGNHSTPEMAKQMAFQW